MEVVRDIKTILNEVVLIKLSSLDQLESHVQEFFYSQILYVGSIQKKKYVVLVKVLIFFPDKILGLVSFSG